MFGVAGPAGLILQLAVPGLCHSSHAAGTEPPFGARSLLRPALVMLPEHGWTRLPPHVPAGTRLPVWFLTPASPGDDVHLGAGWPRSLTGQGSRAATPGAGVLDVLGERCLPESFAKGGQGMQQDNGVCGLLLV